MSIEKKIKKENDMRFQQIPKNCRCKNLTKNKTKFKNV